MKTAPKLTASQMKIAMTATKCVEHLIKSGKTPTEAEDAVIEILKEAHETYTNASLVCGMLEMIFLNKNVDVVADNLVKNRY